MAGPDYIVDIDGVGDASPQRVNHGVPPMRGRPWLAIHWKCCSTYSRIYRNNTVVAYEGRCPRCAKAIRVPIGNGGTSNRFFEAS